MLEYKILHNTTGLLKGSKGHFLTLFRRSEFNASKFMIAKHEITENISISKHSVQIDKFTLSLECLKALLQAGSLH